jgi:hypothetical protein
MSEEQFGAAISAGVVRPETMVCRGGWPQWCQAGQVPGLLPASAAMPPVHAATPRPVEPKPVAAGPASAPADSWFYSAGDRPVGPMSAEQLRAAVLAGAVRPETMVCHSTWPQWCPAGQVTGLIPASPAIPPVQAAPAPSYEPSPSPEIRIQVDLSDQARSEPQPKRRKKKLSLATALLLLATVAVGIAGAVVLGVVLSNPPTAERDVARAPDGLERERSRDRTKERPEEPGDKKEADDTDFNPGKFKPGADSAYNRTTFEILAPPTPQGRIDELVFAKWKQLGIEPANQCSDAVFLRRVYLDVIGTLPTVEEARAFLGDKSPDKRSRLIDALLERPEFADFWAMKWSDLLRVKAEFPINLWPNAAQAYHHWIREAIKTNMPYDKFVRALLTSSGSNFRTPQVNFYRALQSKDPKGIAQAVALTFMGMRADKWPAERLAGMSAFFFKVGYKPTGEWKEEIVIFDPHKNIAPPPTPETKPGAKTPAKTKSKPAPPPKPAFPDGTPAEIASNKDPRAVFADWLITPQNPWFARHIVNRVWYWLQGRGIVHEPDDFRPDNPPSNPELLNWLAEEFTRTNYDLKHMYRLILNSSTYQLSSIPKSTNPQAGVHFASYTVRRLEAEVIIDALNQITGTTESYSSIIPEPYTFIPETRRAIALPDGSITSSFLELFGRPPRDSGMESERNNRVTASQRLHLLNSSHVRNKLRDGPGMKKLLQEGNSSENLYLAILSRLPGDGEWGSGESLAWTLVNSTEFLFRH